MISKIRNEKDVLRVVLSLSFFGYSHIYLLLDLRHVCFPPPRDFLALDARARFFLSSHFPHLHAFRCTFLFVCILSLASLPSSGKVLIRISFSMQPPEA